MVALLVLGGIVIVGAVVLIVVGIRVPQSDDVLEKRLAEYSTFEGNVNLEEIELSQPFSERIIYPLARKMGEVAAKLTPQNFLQNTAKKLELAGNPGRMEPSMVLVMQFGAGILFGGLLVLVFSVAKTHWSLGRIFLLVAVFTLLGFYFPQMWLTSKIGKRQKEVRRGMPDALDLLTICVEAGLGFDAAMAKVSEKWENELSLAFGRVIREIQLGKLRREAMRDMADRIGISEMTSFVAAVIQSEQLGVSMAKVLRIQSDQMRIKRRQMAEEEAHKAPIKMLVPMAGLIFPSLMIVLLTPAALKLFHSALGNMFK
jgi:tight adherence protein C